MNNSPYEKVARLMAVIIWLAAGLVSVAAQEDEAAHAADERPRHGVKLIIFSPDAQTLAVVKGDLSGERYQYNSRVELWDAKGARLKRSLTEFEGPVIQACFSSDGKWLATSSWELKDERPSPRRGRYYNATGIVKVWDVETGELKWFKKDFTNDVSSIIFSPDDRALVTAGAERGMASVSGVKVWDSQTGDLIRKLGYRAPVTGLAFSPDGRLLAVRKLIYFDSKSEVKLYDFASWKELRTLKETKGIDRGPFSLYNRGMISASKSAMKNMVFSPDGRRLAVGAAGLVKNELFNEINIWDVESGSLDKTIKVGRTDVTGRGGRGEYMLLYRLLRRNSELVEAIAYSADGTQIAAINSDVIMKVWDVETGEVKKTGRSKNPATAVAFSPGVGQIAIASLDGAVEIWDYRTGAIKQALVGTTESRSSLSIDNLVVSATRVSSLAFSPDGQTLATASDTLRLWDVRAALEKNRYSDPDGDIYSAVYSPDGKSIATAGPKGKVKILDSQAGSIKLSIAAHDGEANMIAFSPDGQTLASAGADRSIKIWSVGDGKLKMNLGGGADSALAVSFSKDGKLIAGAGADGSVRLWDAASGKLTAELPKSKAAVNAIAFSPDGRLLASGGADKAINIWDTQTGQLKQTLSGHQGAVSCLEFSPDGTLLASGSDDKSIRIWDAQTGRTSHTLKGHEVAVYSLAFSPDGQLLAAGSGNDSIALWEPRTGQLKRVMKEPKRIQLRK